MFERFTERARQVVILAQDESRGFKHNYIGTEHILLGLIREEQGLGAAVLEEHGLTLETVRADIARTVGHGDHALYGQIPFTSRAKKTLELALREALSLGHNYIGTEHVLLGLVREPEGVAARILQEHEITAEQIRVTIIKRLPTFPPRQEARPYKPPDRCSTGGYYHNWRLLDTQVHPTTSVEIVRFYCTQCRAIREDEVK